MKNRLGNSKAGIYISSELWKPQEQNICIKNAVLHVKTVFCWSVFALI